MCSPSSGVWSILKSPVCSTTPAGVWIATATQSGMLCVTRRNSIVKLPTVDALARLDLASAAPATSAPCSSSFGSTSASVSFVPKIGPSKCDDHVRHGADVVLVAVRQHERLDPVPLPAGAGPG